MKKCSVWRASRVLLAAGMAAGILLAAEKLALGFTPESPEVQKMVAKAAGFLESKEASDSRVGAQALIGLTLVKNGASPDHPKVVQSVNAIKSSLNRADPTAMHLDVYSTGLAIIFLADLDPGRYRGEINALLHYLESIQKAHGGWGYPDRPTGDTSMTQYAVLSLWEAKRAGFDVPFQRIERVTDWLLRTQDPSGGFGYQGNVAPRYDRLVPQKEIKLSMTVAGLGSLYICADLLGLGKPPREEPDLPPALKKVKQEDERRAPKTVIDPRWIYEAQARGNRWMNANYRIHQPTWSYYYLYALERYCSFREAAEGTPEGELKWYNDGVEFLMKGQAENGSWKAESGIVPCTAFGALFLLRSTKKSIEKAKTYGSGMLVGGRGLPRDTDAARVYQGRIVALPELPALAQVLDAVEDPEDPEFARAVEELAALPAETGKALLSKHAEKLRELAGGDSPQARIAAIRALAKTGNLDHVPTLIYALNDPDPSVMREARAGLERLSRKFTGFGPPDRPTEAQRREAIQAWKEWFLSVRPDAEFEE